MTGDEMNDDDKLYCEIHDFVTAELEGLATAEQRAQFEELLDSIPQARQVYLAYIDELSGIRWSFSLASESPHEILVEEQLPIEVDFSSRPTVGHPESTSSQDRIPLAKLAWLALLLAASLLVGIGWFVSANRESQPQFEQAAPAAEGGWVVSLDDVTWPGHPQEPLQELSRVPFGESIAFESGVMDLMLSSGAEIVIEGPAEFVLKSTKRALVQKGKFVVRCGPDAVGFEVESPDAKVIDLGTVFGISVVDNERTDVVVYDGAVDLSARGSSKPLAQRLTAGEAIHVSRHGSVGRISLLPNDRLLMPRGMSADQSGRSPLILAVRDNLQDSETKKFYRIVQGGFQEECEAFVDRDHQWNGLDGAGLPPFLVKGDYVMTFNDDKVRRVSIDLELSAPASVYLLFDNRVPIPEWLKSEFKDTGRDIGLDEGYDDRDHVSVGKGPGKSIDQVFSVWRKDYTQPTSVKLKPTRLKEINVDPRTVEQSMYGIVVTELGTGSPPPGT